MKAECVDFLVEERSMEAALRELLPRMLGTVPFRIHTHRCKDELLTKLPDRLRGYAAWIPKTWRLIVVVDRDDDDCERLKDRIEAMAAEAGLTTRTTNRATGVVVTRIAIEELEAWYFGDWHAVRRAFPRVPDTIPKKSRYRNPDQIQGGTWETFLGVLQRHGYCSGGPRKIDWASRIAVHMRPDENRSPSFRAFHSVIKEISGAP